MSEITVSTSPPLKRGGRQKSELAKMVDGLEIGQCLGPVNKAQSVYYATRARQLGSRLSCERLPDGNFRLHRTV